MGPLDPDLCNPCGKNDILFIASAAASIHILEIQVAVVEQEGTEDLGSRPYNGENGVDVAREFHAFVTRKKMGFDVFMVETTAALPAYEDSVYSINY